MFLFWRIVTTGFLAIAVLMLVAVVDAGAASPQFHARLANRIDGKSARVGDPVRATLTESVNIGGITFPPGSQLSGTITSAQKARRFIQAEVSPRRWLKPGGAISMRFTRIAGGGRSARLSAVPIAVTGGGQVRAKGGRLESAPAGQVRSKVGRLALTGLSFIAAPVAPLIGGAVGVVKPDVVLPDAQDAKGRRHRRLKGMAAGAIAGVPGGFLINDTVLKGRSLYIQPGTVLLLQQEQAGGAASKGGSKHARKGGSKHARKSGHV